MPRTGCPRQQTRGKRSVQSRRFRGRDEESLRKRHKMQCWLSPMPRNAGRTAARYVMAWRIGTRVVTLCNSSGRWAILSEQLQAALINRRNSEASSSPVAKWRHRHGTKTGRLATAEGRKPAEVGDAVELCKCRQLITQAYVLFRECQVFQGAQNSGVQQRDPDAPD